MAVTPAGVRVMLGLGYDPLAGSRILFDRFATKAAVKCDSGSIGNGDCACANIQAFSDDGFVPCLNLARLRPAPRLAA